MRMRCSLSSHAQLYGDVQDHNLGHVFIEPKRHVPELADLTEAEAQAIGLYTSRVAQALMHTEGMEHVYCLCDRGRRAACACPCDRQVSRSAAGILGSPGGRLAGRAQGPGSRDCESGGPRPGVSSPGQWFDFQCPGAGKRGMMADAGTHSLAGAGRSGPL